MAIALVASNGFTGTGTSFSLSDPDGTATAGSLLVVLVQTESGATFTMPAGWTHEINGKWVFNIYDCDVFYRVVQSGDSTSFTLSAAASENVTGQVLEFSGCDTTTPIADSSINDPGAVTSVTASSVTVAEDGSALLFAGGNTSGLEMTAPSGYTDLRYTTSASGGGLTTFYKLSVSSGATGSVTATQPSSNDCYASLLAISPAAGGGGGPSVSSGLVGHWRLDGDATADVGNNGTAGGGFSYATDAPSALSGEISQCPDMDGTNDYISAAITTDGFSAISVSFWFKTSSNLTGKYLISLPESSAGGNGFDFRATSTTQMANYCNATTTNREKPISLTYGTGAWIHIVFSYDASGGVLDKLQTFVNGTKQSVTADPAGNIETAAGEINIGRFGTFGAYSQARFSDVRVYNRQISSSEVTDIYNGDYTGGGSSGGAAVQYYRRVMGL